MSSGNFEKSLLSPVGYRTSSCGYCKQSASSQRTQNSRASYYLTTKRLLTDDYQDLVDRGWRRSGTLLYKPDNRLSCCSQYTIRIPVVNLKVRKDQRQAVSRWNRHVLGSQYALEAARKHGNLKGIPSLHNTIGPCAKATSEKSRRRTEFDLGQSLQESEEVQLQPGVDAEHCFRVDLEDDDFSEEKFELFKNYQQHVHKEPPSAVTRSGFVHFLCNSPLVRENRYDGALGRMKKFGSYHQTYRLDGRLIAMGVVDLLDHCVSGVYFMYHQDYERWSFGKMSALREANLALEEKYNYYYMGYYIHTCQKMQYKADYQPQYFLDNDSYGWDPLDEEAKALMLRQKYVSMSRHRRETELGSNAGAGGSTDSTATPAAMHLVGTAAEVVENQLSALVISMPGVMTPDEVERSCDLDSVAVRIGRGNKQFTASASDISIWEQGDVTDASSLKGIVAEMAGCVGPEVMRRVIVNFSSG